MKDLHLSPKHSEISKHSGNALHVTHYLGEPDFLFHFHPEYELVLILGGSGSRLVGNTVTGYTYYDFVFLGPDLPHTWASDVQSKKQSDCHNYVIQFSRDSLGQDFLGRNEMQALNGFLDRAARGLSFPLEAVEPAVGLMKSLETLAGVRRMTTFLTLMDSLSTCPAATPIVSADYDRPFHLQNHVVLGKILEYIHTNYDRIISLEEAAAHFRMSVTTFCRFFKRVTGTSFVDYVNDWRISRACGLLREDTGSILDISAEAGFNNLSHFNRQFLKRQHMTPRAYRRLKPEKT
jgi:AraC-like DNA-binding protein